MMFVYVCVLKCRAKNFIPSWKFIRLHINPVYEVPSNQYLVVFSPSHISFPFPLTSLQLFLRCSLYSINLVQCWVFLDLCRHLMGGNLNIFCIYEGKKTFYDVKKRRWTWYMAKWEWEIGNSHVFMHACMTIIIMMIILLGIRYESQWGSTGTIC